eukprot:3177392-Prymnesium_polylepis.1
MRRERLGARAPSAPALRTSATRPCACSASIAHEDEQHEDEQHRAAAASQALLPLPSQSGRPRRSAGLA